MTKTISIIIFSLLFVLSTQYDQGIATEMAKASFATYCASDRLTGMKCGANCNSLQGYSFVDQLKSKISIVESLTYSTFINKDKKRVILAFRGTNTATQLAKEIGLSAGVSFGLCPNVKNAKSLLYFYNGYQTKLRSSFLAHVKELIKLYPNFDYFITGHSLGGALATIASLDLSCNGVVNKSKLRLYTFGSPRVGDVNFATAVQNAVAEHWRITHDKDMVPHVPPCKINALGQCTSENLGLRDTFLGAFNYGWHLGHEVYYNQDFSSYKICDAAEDSSCANKTPLIMTSVIDHLNYLGTIQSCY